MFNLALDRLAQVGFTAEGLHLGDDELLPVGWFHIRALGRRSQVFELVAHFIQIVVAYELAMF